MKPITYLLFLFSFSFNFLQSQTANVPKDKTQFFKPFMEHPSTMPGKEILPYSVDRKITDESYCNGLPIKDFDVSNPIPNQGIIAFPNKYRDVLWVKNAHWVDEENNENGSLRLFQNGDAELLLFRDGKWYYHFGYSVSEATSFGWNIYSRSDGQFELGLVGGNRTLYTLEELPYKMPEDRFKTEIITYNGRKANYHGQMENNLPNGFGFIDSLNVVMEFGFWENGTLLDTRTLLNKLYEKNGIKTMEIILPQATDKILRDEKEYRKRTITGFFEISKEKHKEPYGWFSSTLCNDDVTAAFSGYMPDEKYKNDVGFLESPDFVYGVFISRALKKDIYGLDPKMYNGEKEDFGTRLKSFVHTPKSNSDYFLQWYFPGYRLAENPEKYTSIVPALTFNWASQQQFDYIAEKELELKIAEENAKKEEAEAYRAQARIIFDNSKFKPGQIIRYKSGQYCYVNKINFKDGCLELIPFPVLATSAIFSTKTNTNTVDGSLFAKNYLSATYQTKYMFNECSFNDYTLANVCVCDLCSGTGILYENETVYTGGSKPGGSSTNVSQGDYMTTVTTTSYSHVTVSSHLETNSYPCEKCNSTGIISR